MPTFAGWKTYAAAAALAAWAVIEPAMADGSLLENVPTVLGAAGLAALRAGVAKAMGQVEQLSKDLRS